jgi:hypothetical protein
MGKKLTQQEIIEQFKKVHRDLYDYSLVQYINDSTKVKIICKEHGIFEQQVGCHKRQKQGCPKCRNIKIGKSQQVGNKPFIERIEKIFGENTFDYSLLDYNGAHKPVILICKKCNNKEIKSPSVFYKGFGCLKCSDSKIGRKNLTTEEFIEKANKIHNNLYDYSLVKYKNNKTKIKILCPKHGMYHQTPSTHLDGKSGCPYCHGFKGEKDILLILERNKLEYIFQYSIKIDNSYHYFDFYLPEKNIIIEFNGKQHYEPIDFFGGVKGFEITKYRDKIKEKYCIDNNINFIVISYKDNIKEKLNLALNIK